MSACSPLATVWVDNRSPDRVVFFVTDNSDQAAAWYVVPPNVAAHLGSHGLHVSGDVRVSVVGWPEGGDPCRPANYDDTIYDVAPGASIRLRMGPDGAPSVAIAPEPPNLPPLDPMEVAPC